MSGLFAALALGIVMGVVVLVALALNHRGPGDGPYHGSLALLLPAAFAAMLAVTAQSVRADEGQAGVPGEAPAAASVASPAPPSASGAHLNLDAGAGTLAQRGNTEAFVAARATLAFPVTPKLRAFVRADLDRVQDAGSLDSLAAVKAIKEQFRAIEVGAGARYYVAPGLSVAGVGGVTYSVDNGTTKPSDPRLWTGLGGICGDIGDIGDGGYGCGFLGWRGPVGGWALTASASLPLHDGLATAIDVDFPLGASFVERAYTVKVRALVRLKTIKF